VESVRGRQRRGVLGVGLYKIFIDLDAFCVQTDTILCKLLQLVVLVLVLNLEVRAIPWGPPLVPWTPFAGGSDVLGGVVGE